MKVINYGPNREPKTLICASCQSELEYDFKDIKFNSRLVFDKTILKLKQICGVYVYCPVCSYANALDEKEFPYTPKEPPKKRKWFGRKETANEK